MKKIEVDSSNIIYFHFDTVESKLSIASFNQLVDSLNVVTNNVSKVFIGEKVKCSIFILPPEDGSFKSKFCIFLAGAMLSGPIGNFSDGMIQELTGHDSKYYGTETVRFVKDVTVGIFSKTREELDRIISDNVNIDEAIEAKSRFYTVIANDKNVKSLGFTDTDKALIKKSEMVYYIAPDKIRDVDNIVEYSKLKIIKAVLERSSQAWTLRDISKKKNDEYKILDDDFTSLVWQGENPLKVTEKTDEILARVEYVKEMKNGKVITKETNITDVYQFNGKVLKELPDDFELNITKVPKKDKRQLSLFDQLKQEEDKDA